MSGEIIRMGIFERGQPNLERIRETTTIPVANPNGESTTGIAGYGKGTVGMSLTGLFIWKSVCAAYFPLESFRSVQDMLDEAILCIDPTSDDQTMELAYAIANKYPWARVIEHVWQTPSVMGSAIGEASNFALKFVNTDLVVNIQADECWSPELTKWVKDNKDNLDLFNVFRFSFLHTRYNAQEIQGGAAYPTAEKMARMYSFLRFAPDAWRFEVDYPRLLHVVESDKYPIVHLHHFFRDGIVQQLKNNIDLFGDENSQIEHWMVSNNHGFLASPIWDKTDSPFVLHELIRPLLGRHSYQIRWGILS